MNNEIARMAADDPAPQRRMVFQRGDELDIASAIRDDLIGTDRWVFSEGSFWRYIPLLGIWDPVDDGEVRRWTHGYAGARVEGKKKDPFVRLSDKSIRGAIKCLADMIADAKFFERPALGICFKNGFVTIRQTKPGHHEIVLLPHSPDNRSTHAMPFSYQEKFKVDRWREFLLSVWRDEDDAEQRIAFVQQFIGVCMIGSITNHEKVMMLYGKGANGKSVLLNVIDELFVAKDRSAVPMQKWAHDYHVAHLHGKKINIVSELPSKELMESQSVKAVISGDVVNARQPHGRSFDYRPQAGHIFAINPPLPTVTDMSDGFWRRWVVLTMNRNFERDPERADKRTLQASLSEELAGIASWALRGALDVVSSGRMADVPSSRAAVAVWRRETDQVSLFVHDACSPAERPADGHDVEDLYHAYKRWHASTGHKNSLALPSFERRLDALNVPVGTTAMGDERIMLSVRPRWARGGAGGDEGALW